MFRHNVLRQLFKATRPHVSKLNHNRFYSASEFGGKKDSGFNIMNFVVVALVGTGIFGVVVHKVDLQDASKSMLKRKNSFTDQEWEQYMNSIKRKVLLFKPTTEIYVVPNPIDSQVGILADKLGTKESVKIINLNDIIADEIKNHHERYGTLLEHHLISQSDAEGYQFDTRLAKGIFSKLMRLKLEKLKEEPDSGNFKYILTNFPNNIQEAIKFESDVAIVRKLVLFDAKEDDVSAYFNTVKKISRLDHKIDEEAIKSLRESV